MTEQSPLKILAVSAHRSDELFVPLYATNSDVTVVSQDSDGLIDLAVRCSIDVWNAMRTESPDVVVGDHAGVPSFITGLLSLLFRTPFVLRLGGNIWRINRNKAHEHYTKRQWGELAIIMLVIAINRITFRLTDGYLAISETVEKAIVDNTRTKRDRIGRIGVPVDRTRFENGSAAEAKEALDLSDERILLTVTNLRFRGKFEGIRAALPEIEQVLESNDDVVYVVLGDGAYHEALMNLIEAELDKSIRKRIYCPGYVDNVENYYAAASALVYVSFIEGFGNIIQEAQIVGCPVVTNDALGMSDQIIDGETGLLVNVNEGGELRTAIQRLLDGPEFAAGLREQARQHVRQASDPAKIGQQIEEFLVGIAKR